MFGCFYENGYIISKSDIMERLYLFNNNRHDSSQSYTLGTINMDPEDVYEAIINTDYNNIRLTYKKLDVYSMGVVLTNLLYEYFSVSLVSGKDGFSFYPFYYDIKSEKYSFFLFILINTHLERYSITNDKKFQI
jgi:hypothetical protein